MPSSPLCPLSHSSPPSPPSPCSAEPRSMFVVPGAQPPTASLSRSGSDQVSGKKSSSEIITSPLLSPISSSMERGAPEYSQSGLPSPYPSTVGDTQSEASSADHATAAPAPYGTQQEVRPATYSATATPTSSDYGAVYPGSARSATFPDTHIRPHYPPSNHGGSSGGMAQTSSPSVPLQDGRSHQDANQKSDTQVPIDPSIAAPSPTTYAHSTYSPYAPPQDMSHPYQQHPASAGMYQQARPDWAGYGQSGGPIPTGHHVFSQTPASAAAQSRPNQVYSFVPIPGAQQHKRPRRRYEEIERMYKCGWNGCEKAYGTLNHLNAHVTMQAHGAKRTPEEFKEIRKEWKARKKEEEAARKAEDERLRTAAAAQNGGPDQADTTQPPTTYAGARTVQLPPIAYGTAQYPAPPSAGIQASLPDGYNGSHVYSNYSPASPYGPSQGMYSQHNGGQTNH